jgi:hypothetical protein
MAYGRLRDPFRHIGCTVRVVIIDPFNKEIRDAAIAPTLRSFQKALGGGLRFARWISASDVLYVCDAPEWPEHFVIGGCRTSGCGVIAGAGTGGKALATSARSVAADLGESVTFERVENELGKPLSCA